jgi:hypothetical protein
MMTSNVVVAHKPENFLSHYTVVYCNCHHLCAFKLCTVYLSYFFTGGHTREEISWLIKAREKNIFFWRIFSTLMLVDSKKERQRLHLPSVVAARGNRRQ